MLGNDKAGPASNNASAGPCPMPAPRRPSRIGTSVSVAKYMKAPATEANRFAPSELPPTARATHSDGIRPSCPGRPRQRPAANTPIKSNGRICLVNPQVAANHSLSSPSSELAVALNATVATPNGSSGPPECQKAIRTGGAAIGRSFHHRSPNQETSTAPRRVAAAPVSHHLMPWIALHGPPTCSGSPQFAKTRIAIMLAK